MPHVETRDRAGFFLFRCRFTTYRVRVRSCFFKFSLLYQRISFFPLPARDHAVIWEKIVGDDCTQEHMPEQSKSHGNSGSVCQPQHMGTQSSH
jgi:hypothetical protein